MPCIFTALIEYEAGSWFSDFICLVSWLPHASDWHFFFFMLRKIFSYSSSGEGVFSVPLETKFAFFFFYACYPKSWFLSVVFFFLVVPAGTFFFTLSLSLLNWSIFFTFSSSSHSLPSAWVPQLMRLSTELIYLSFWIWKWFTPGISVSLLHSSLLSCATFLTSFHCLCSWSAASFCLGCFHKLGCTLLSFNTRLWFL